MDRTTLFWKVGVLAAIVSLSGCNSGDGIERVPLYGSARYQGAPIEDGQIRFVPHDGQGVPLTITTIQAGSYDTSQFGGIPVAKYRVEIQSFDPSTPAPMGPGAPPRTQLLPKEFNEQSTLELDVGPEQANGQYNFEL